MFLRGALLYDVLRHVRPLTLDSARVVEGGLRRHGLGIGMRAVLEVLVEQGPATVPQVADALALQRQGVQRLVNELLERGHVERRENPRHRRSVLIAATDRGRRSFEAIRVEELAQLSAMAADCSDDDIRTAVRVLSSLAADVRRRARQAQQEAM